MHLKERFFHILSLTLLVGVLASSAQAERKFYYYTTGNGFNTAKNFKDPSTGAALSAFDKTGDYWLRGGNSMRTVANSTQKTFNGKEFNIGSPSVAPEGWDDSWGTWWGSTKGTLQSYNSNGTGSVGPLTIADLVWWNGTLYAGDNEPTVAYKFCGTYTLRQADAGVVHETYTSKAHPYVELNATIRTSEEDADADDTVWTIKAGSVASNLDNVDAGTPFVWRMTGNHSAYRGRIRVSAPFQPFVIYNGTILGDTTVANAAALELGTDAAMAVAANFEQNDARGICLTGDRAYFATWGTLANAYTISYPISKTEGAIGQLIKRGPGTVTLAGAYSAGSITVATGALVIAESATFPVGQTITVKAGAKLVVIDRPLRSFVISAEDGAIVEHVVTPIVPVYDPDAKTVATVERADLVIEDGERQTLALSDKITLPSHDALALEVLRVTAGSRDYTEADFEDATEKTYGLPKTSFSVVKGDDGIQHVYLHVRPVVTSVANIGNVGINGVASSWSDSTTPHFGADYLLKHDVGDVQKFGFRGDSLTIATGVELRFRSSEESGNNHSLSLTNGQPVVVYPGVSTTQNFDGREFPLAGLIYLVGDYGDTGVFNYHLKYGETAANQGRLRLDATLLGAGTLQISGAANGTSWSGLNGNNTNFFGKIILTGGSTTAEMKGTQVRVSKPEAFGGRLDEFHPDALTIGSYAMIKATGNVALTNDMNRGIRVGNGGFNCDADKTFETTWPVVLNGTLYKHGAGTLILGGAMTHDTGSTGNFVVRAGTVSALSDEAVAGLTLTATNDFTVAVSPRSTAVNGFGSVALTGDADPKITVAFDVANAEKNTNYRLPICTVESDSGLTADSFVVQKAKGYVCTLVSETVDETKTRWLLDCVKSGLIMMVR